MRKYQDLDKNRQYRLRNYILANKFIHASVLAEDLQLDQTSVIVIKGNDTRKVKGKN